jgi:hypothetical protein
MKTLWQAIYCLGVFGVAWLATPSAHAHGELEAIRAKAAAFCARYHAMHEKTPWYSYFPGGDGGMMEPHAGGATFPTWPSPFPPPQSSWADQQMMHPSGVAGFASPPTAGESFGQSFGPAPFALPVGNSRTSVPSYWYAR